MSVKNQLFCLHFVTKNVIISKLYMSIDVYVVILEKEGERYE